ncbi:MAG: DegT/DnrJ/EryC1/StrS family aminotransferase [Lachnospiraceae bacterium]|nr:DegT/DnrJ/EryC1/StrS family aminotransferase [Lachnospiraceae bacterium]
MCRRRYMRINVTRSSMPSFEEYTEAIKPLWESAWLTNMGVNHEKLAERLSEYLKVDNVSLFVNGHMALEMTLQAMGLSGEVITTPFTFASTTHAIVRNGLEPVFCDIDKNTYTIDASKIEDLITEKTCAILPVHVYGCVCDVEEIDRIAKAHGLKVIYDSAHAFGVEYKGRGIGTFGDASMFSFHATKVYNTIEGGAVTTADAKLMDMLRKLKDFGIKDEEVIDGIGANAKMNEFCAVMGLCNLLHVDEEIEKRRKVVDRYRQNLSDEEGLTILPVQKDVKPNYAYFPVVVEEKIFGAERQTIIDRLKEDDIYVRKYFYPLTSDMDCYQGRFDSSMTPVAKYTAERVITLPMSASLTENDVDRICGIIRSCRGAAN